MTPQSTVRFAWMNAASSRKQHACLRLLAFDGLLCHCEAVGAPAGDERNRSTWFLGPPSGTLPAMDTLRVERAQLDEAELLSGMRAGEESCFAQCVERHGPRMMAVARRLLAHEEDAQDAVQDAFLSAFQAIARFDGRSQLGTWLHRIAVNSALGKLRVRRTMAQTAIDDLLPRFKDDGHQLEPAVEWGETAAAVIERSETREVVRRTIEQLPQIYCTVLLLRDVEGLDTEEVARLLDVTCGVIKTRLHRARQALRTLLDGRFRRGDL
jgi:RNA polymerase sigma-70 factor (ECF subfamily)